MAGGYSVVISATDQVTATIDRINARLGKFNSGLQKQIDATTAPFRRLSASIAKFSDVSGLNRVGGAVRGLARAGADAYQKVGQLVPLIGIIGSVASVAGITRMVSAWTEWGSRVGFTAQRIGISTDKLSALQGAARLAGSSAEGAANGLQTLGQTIYDAIGGRAPEAIVMFRTLGIAFQDATGHARSVTDVLPEVADKIKAIRDPFAQAQVAAALFGGAAEDLLPFLRKGSEGIREYTDMARRYGVFSDASAAAANRLREAQAQVSLAVEGLRNRIAERLEPILTPMLSQFADWLATSPQVTQAVGWLGDKVQQLGTFLAGVDWPALGTRLDHWGDTIAHVTDLLGGPMHVIEALMALMVGRFALQVIAPFWTLGTAIAASTVKLTALTVGMSRLGGGAGLLGRIGGLAGTLGLAGAGWEGLNLAQDATQPSGDGVANLLHNMLFDMNPLHWAQSYHPGQEGGSAGARLGVPDKSAAGLRALPSGDMAAREKQAFDYFVSQGRSPQAAAGVVASLERESLGNERNNTGDGGQAYGIGQWHADRQEHFKQIFGHDIRDSTFGEQLQFKRMELDGTGGDPGSAKAGQLMRMPGSTAGQAGAADSRFAERPGDADGEAQRRGSLAEQILARQQAPAIAPPAAQGPPMQLASNGGGDGQTKDATVRLDIHGTMDKGMSMSVAGAHGATVSGPLVTQPQLLGAMP